MSRRLKITLSDAVMAELRGTAAPQSPRHPLARDIIGLAGRKPRDVRILVVIGEHGHVERRLPASPSAPS